MTDDSSFDPDTKPLDNSATANPGPEPLAPKDVIYVLVNEWTSIRTEAVHRTNNMYQLIAALVAAILWCLGGTYNCQRIVGCVVLSVAFVFFALVINRDLWLMSCRMRAIESEVNRIAGQQLLKWESTWANYSFKGVFKRKPGT